MSFCWFYRFFFLVFFFKGIVQHFGKSLHSFLSDSETRRCRSCVCLGTKLESGGGWPSLAWSLERRGGGQLAWLCLKFKNTRKHSKVHEWTQCISFVSSSHNPVLRGTHTTVSQSAIRPAGLHSFSSLSVFLPLHIFLLRLPILAFAVLHLSLP